MGVNMGTMFAFDAGGTIRWNVGGNWQPQIATEDGGVIATNQDTGTAATFDQNGNATGQMGSLPVQSLGYAYQIGSVEQVWKRAHYVVGGYWPFKEANLSRSGAAVLHQWFPPLASCTDSGGDCQGQLGPGDLLWNAKEDLARQLASNSDCQSAAQGFLNLFSGTS